MQELGLLKEGKPMLDSNGNGSYVKLNTAILIWLGGLTFGAVFYAGISLERLNNLKENMSANEVQRKEENRLIDLRFSNQDSEIKAIKIANQYINNLPVIPTRRK